MPKIDIAESEIDSLISYYSSLKNKYSTEVKSWTEKLEMTTNTLNQLISAKGGTPKKIFFDSNIAINPIPGYSENMTWVKKIEAVLNKANGKWLTAREIVNNIVEIEPKYSDDIVLATRSVSATLTSNSKDSNGAFIRKMNERGEYAYTTQL